MAWCALLLSCFAVDSLGLSPEQLAQVEAQNTNAPTPSGRHHHGHHGPGYSVPKAMAVQHAGGYDLHTDTTPITGGLVHETMWQVSPTTKTLAVASRLLQRNDAQHVERALSTRIEYTSARSFHTLLAKNNFAYEGRTSLRVRAAMGKENVTLSLESSGDPPVQRPTTGTPLPLRSLHPPTRVNTRALPSDRSTHLHA